MPQEPAVQGPFTSEFTGLTLNNKGGGASASSSPVFHNCEIDIDGSVKRRGGTRVLTDDAVTGRRWVTTVKTRRGSEYLISVDGAGIKVQLFLSIGGVATFATTFTKTNVFSRPLTEVYFVQVSAPYDKLLIFTGNHPIIQISLIERLLTYTCTNGSTGALTATFTNNDSKTWLDNVASNYGLLDTTQNVVYTVNTKSPGFDVITSGGLFTTSQVIDLVLIQCTWQWWAESITWEGKDFVQALSRVNVTVLDQNIEVPLDLITDLEPRYLTSPYIGLICSKTSNHCNPPGLVYAGPTNTPNLVDEYGFSTGGRYIFNAATPLNHGPFFVTCGTTETAGTISQIYIIRQRELRFNGGTGILVADLDVYVDNTKSVSYQSGCVAGATFLDHVVMRDTYTTQRNFVVGAVAPDKATGIIFLAAGNTLASDASVVITNTQTNWLGSNARKVWYKGLPSGGGNLDGTYVAAFGLGSFADYQKGYFPVFGALFRDRLILKNHPTAADQLVVSATADVVIIGEFYTYFQITDALTGSVDDPFTINITSNSRETITGLLGWQQSFFVFTNVSTYAISPGEVFGPNNFSTGLVSSFGAYNNNCVVATNLTILCINRFGVFDILNKSNSSDYGAFERSQSVRELFIADVPDRLDYLPFAVLNDSTNTVTIGLPVDTDTTSCSRLLTLNLTWNAWSTISSAVPFKSFSATQLLDSIVMSASYLTRALLLQTDSPIFLDYQVTTVSSFPFTVSLPYQEIVRNQTTRGVIKLPIPTTPVFKEFNATNTNKQLLTYVSTSLADVSALTPRNIMLDSPDLLPFLGTTPPATLGVVVVITNEDAFPFYARPSTYTNTATANCTIPLPTGFNGVNATNLVTSKLVGLSYTSMYSTPVINLESLGRLKRLKKVHLLFNSELANKQPYGTVRKTRMNNSAIVQYVLNYREQAATVETRLLTDADGTAGNNLATHKDVRGRLQLSLVLAGYGCDYQVFVVSAGVDGFNLIGYEFDVQAANVKRYVRDV